MIMKRILMVLAGSAFFAGAATAADFQVWTYADKGGRGAVLAVSFIGDGATQEAQIDLRIPEGFRVDGSAVKTAGSVCAASAEKGLIRAVPPSGEGKPLPSGMMEVCTFKLVSTGEKAVGKPKIEVAFKECADSAGERACGVQTPDMSER
jgi:hypothetical protein